MYLTYTFSEPVCVELKGGPESEDTLRFLRSYFEPFFEFTEESGIAPKFTIDLRIGDVDKSIFESPDASEMTIDSSGAFLKCQAKIAANATGGDVLLLPFEAQVTFLSDLSDVQLKAVSAERLKVPALRLIEDLVTGYIEDKGAVFVHSSAVVANGKSVITVGNKKAGKTSFVCNALSCYEVDKMANDCCILWQENKQLMSAGWPGFFKIDVATVSRHWELAANFPVEELHRLNSDSSLWSIYEKVALFPAEGAQKFDSKITPIAPVAAIIISSFTEDEPAEIKSVALDEHNLESILDCVQGSQHPNHLDAFGNWTTSKSELHENLRTMLLDSESWACYAMKWGKSLVDLLSDVPNLRESRKSVMRCRELAGTTVHEENLPKIFE